MFSRTLRLTHEFDESLRRYSLGNLLRSKASSFRYSRIRDRVTVDITCIRDFRYRETFPAFYEPRYSRPDMRLLRLDNAIVAGGAPTLVMAADGTAIVDSYGLEDVVTASGFGAIRDDRFALHNKRHRIQAMGKPYSEANALNDYVRRPGRPAEIFDIPEPVYLLIGRWHGMYGHFSHEACAQVSFWRDHLKPRGVKLLARLNEWQWALLASIGVRRSDLITAPEELFVWDYERLPVLACKTAFFSCSYEYNTGPASGIGLPVNAPGPELLTLSRESTLVPKRRRGGRRIYAARLDTQNRKLVNERELIQRLVPLGFEILVGSEMSVKSQIEAFANADIVVGKDGTNLTNLMYCRPGTPFVEILSEAYFDSLYMRIANLAGLTYDNVLAPVVAGTTKQGRDRECRVDLDEVVLTIERALAR